MGKWHNMRQDFLDFMTDTESILTRKSNWGGYSNTSISDREDVGEILDQIRAFRKEYA
jgi:hypothetical protein